MTNILDRIEAVRINEDEFKKSFYSLTNPDMQLEELAKWRRFQIGVVSTFIEQIRTVAGDQYTNLDHFLLELLQNADDNKYKEGVKPTVELKLTNEKLTLYNNEIGFTPENVFSITHNAASSKNVKKTAATFIGEKGIGFKSVFAVADYVDIHSGPYHFRLKNNEYIVPYAINPKEITGTEIVLKFKETNEIPQILSESLKFMCDSSHEFILFLQKIEKLNIQDNVSSADSEIITFRDKKTNIYTVKSRGEKRRFVTFSYKETMPADVVTSRFSELHDNMEREIVFAVPIPQKSNEVMSKNGKVFCFLPTEIDTVTPIHLQVDAETTTNRANIKNCASSIWNKTIFQNISHNLVNVYLKLTENDTFKDYLPEYWPCIEYGNDLHNKDIQAIIVETMELLKDKPVILDHHGNFKSPLFVRRIPNKFPQYFYESKYEKTLSRCIYKEVSEECGLSEYIPEETFSLVSENWAHKYPNQLESIGVKEIGYEICLEMLKEGVPSAVNINDDKSVRKFLRTVMSFAVDIKDEYVLSPFQKAIELLKECPIYPLKIDNKKQWGSLTQDIIQLKTDSSNPKGTFKLSIIDPLYTYNPGGNIKTKDGEIVKDFNAKFRDFLSNIMTIQDFTKQELLHKTHISHLRKTCANPNDLNEREEINKMWFTIYNDIWKRKKTIIHDNRPQYWTDLLRDISYCKIPVWIVSKKEWELKIVSLALLGNQFNKAENFDKEYSETDAPIINFDFLNPAKKGKSRKKKNKNETNLDDWRYFLEECGAKTIPYYHYNNLSKNADYYYFGNNNGAYSNNDNIFAKRIISSVLSHKDINYDGTSSFSLVDGSWTWVLDDYTKMLLSKGEKTDFVAKKLSAQWDEINKKKTDLKFIWGLKQKPRETSCNEILLYEEIRNGLILQTDKGFQKSSECFEDNKFNKDILKELGTYVNPDEVDYNKNLLQVIGVKEKVSLADISDLIVRWYQRTSQEQRSSKTFAPFLEAIDRFFLYREVSDSVNKTQLQLYSEQEDVLLPYDEWKESISLGDYSQDIIQNLKNNLNENLRKLANLSEEAGMPLDILEFAQQHPDVISLLIEDPKKVDMVRARAERKEKSLTFPENKPVKPEQRIKKIRKRLEEAPSVSPVTQERIVRPPDIEKHIMLSHAYTDDKSYKMICQICKNEMPFKMRNGQYYFEAVGAFSKSSVEDEAQYLALCPLCAAMYKEFIKRDEHAMHELKSKLYDSEELEIPIRLGELETTVRFVETHFIDIKQFLREDNKRKLDNQEP